MSEAKVFEALMKNKEEQHDVEDVAEQSFRAGYEAGLKAAEKTEEKHWNECRQISEYQAENKRLKELLRETMEDLEEAEDCDTCLYNEPETICPGTADTCGYTWRHADEVVKLIGGGENG